MDPELGHHANCTPKQLAETEALQLEFEANAEVRRGRKRPFKVYTDAAEESQKIWQSANRGRK